MSHVVEVHALSEAAFPGIQATHQELLSWEWIYAKTPKFTLDNDIHVEAGIIKAASNQSSLIGQKFYPESSDILSNQHVSESSLS